MDQKLQIEREPPAVSEALEVDTSLIDSVVLAKLIEEVRQEETSTVHLYDRVHNRHNRGR